SEYATRFAAHLLFNAHHVHDRNSLRYADDEFHPGIDRFQNRIRSSGGGYKNHRYVATGLRTRLCHSVKDRHLTVKFLSAFAWRNAGDDIRAVFHALPGMKRPGTPGNSLNEEPRVFVDEDRHKDQSGTEKIH